MQLADYEALGRIAWPSMRGYPTRDVHSADEESAYLTGWNMAGKLAQFSDEPSGDDIMGGY